MSGKGSGRRPAAISAQEFAEKWAQTFGKMLARNGVPRITGLTEPRAEANADAPTQNADDAP